MNQPKRFVVQSAEHIPPITFEISDDRGRSLGLFHADPRPRFDLLERMALAVGLDGQGGRIHQLDILTRTIHDILLEERFDPEAGEWKPCDDRQRFTQLIQSPRVRIPIEQLGDIVTWLVEMTTANPTGGSSPSSPGPSVIPSTSPDSSPHAGLTLPPNPAQQFSPSSGSFS